jgi:predicted GNAT family acetyltransferase
MVTALAVQRNDARSRFEGRRDGELVSLVDYVLRGDTMIVIHTGTEHRWRGNG